MTQPLNDNCMKKSLFILLLAALLLVTGCGQQSAPPPNPEEEARVNELNTKLSGRGTEYNYTGPNLNTPNEDLSPKR